MQSLNMRVNAQAHQGRRAVVRSAVANEKGESKLCISFIHDRISSPWSSGFSRAGERIGRLFQARVHPNPPSLPPLFSCIWADITF